MAGYQRFVGCLLLFVMVAGLVGSIPSVFARSSPTISLQQTEGGGAKEEFRVTEGGTPNETAEVIQNPTDDGVASDSGLDEAAANGSLSADAAAPVTNESPYYTMEELRESSDTAPQQPFWNHWLWLAAFVVVVTCYANVAMRDETPEAGSGSFRRLASRFSLRFAIPYFVLFGFPQPLVSWIPWGAWQVMSAYKRVMDGAYVWMAENVLHFESKLSPMSGSGDSTYDYVSLLLKCLVAFVIALVWTLLDRRRVDSTRLRGWLNGLVALLLASTLVTYGMVKFCWFGNQFMPISGVQLQAEWGDCSPMGVLWRFMSTSPSYTYFAGLAELIGGILLVFRKTRLLGALVGGGAMLNVVLLNFCYDVPVKINSTHYLLMAVFLTVPHFGRLANVFVFDRQASPLKPAEPINNRLVRWGMTLARVVFVGWVIFFPIARHYYAQFDLLLAEPSLIAGSYLVEDNELVGNGDGSSDWRYVRIVEFPMGGSGDNQRVYLLMVNTHGDKSFRGMFSTSNETDLEFQMSGQANFPVGIGLLKKSEAGTFQFSATTPLAAVRMKWIPIDRTKSRLLGRGFRWVNEVPYNR